MSTPPRSQRIIITENSGNGPTYHVVMVGGLPELDDAKWQLIVDGSPLQDGAVIIATKIPK